MTVWTTPKHSRTTVSRAGAKLAAKDFVSDGDRDECLSIINNWRSAHAYPLQALKMALKHRARRVDAKAVIAQRLKRLTSIDAKLLRFPHMKLAQMQDIGGCRAVVTTWSKLEQLAGAYDRSVANHREGRSELSHVDNYIENPKDDGYRGIHLVYKYHTQSVKAELQSFDGLRIEIQLRSMLQHAWATAVEIVDAFTDQALKTGYGKAPWKRFFRLAGSLMAHEETLPLVPGTPTDLAQLLDEFRQAEERLGAVAVLQGYQEAMYHIAETSEDADYYLLILDTKGLTVTVKGFTAKERSNAEEEYLEREKRIANDLRYQIVLVAVDSVAALKNAYPNYYLNTTLFLNGVKRAVGKMSAIVSRARG